MTFEEFSDLLDEAPRTPTSLLVQTRQGERRSVPLSALTGRVEFRSRHPETERRARWLELTGYLLEKEDKE